MIRLIRWAIVCIALVCLSCSESSDPKAKTMSMFDAINRHDVSGALAYFADDVHYVMNDGSSITGKPALRKLFQFDSTMGTKAEISGVWVSGDTVVVDTTVESSDWGRLMKIPGMRSYPGSRFVFEKGLIKRVEYSASFPEDENIFRSRMTAFLKWFVYVHPERIDEVKNRTFVQFNAECASDLMKLAEEWQEWRSSRGMLN
jgi:hypothetical protein